MSFEAQKKRERALGKAVAFRTSADPEDARPTLTVGSAPVMKLGTLVLELKVADKESKVYFMGPSINAILEDVKPVYNVISHRFVSISRARELRLDLIDEGIGAVTRGAKSFMLHNPRSILELSPHEQE